MCAVFSVSILPSCCRYVWGFWRESSSICCWHKNKKLWRGRTVYQEKCFAWIRLIQWGSWDTLTGWDNLTDWTRSGWHLVMTSGINCFWARLRLSLSGNDLHQWPAAFCLGEAQTAAHFGCIWEWSQQEIRLLLPRVSLKCLFQIKQADEISYPALMWADWKRRKGPTIETVSPASPS